VATISERDIAPISNACLDLRIEAARRAQSGGFGLLVRLKYTQGGLRHGSKAGTEL